MSNGYFKIARPINEPVLSYLPGSPERKQLKDELKKQSEEVVKIPLIIDGKEVWTDNTKTCVMPHNHGHVLCEYCVAGEKELKDAIQSSLKAKKAYEEMPVEHRFAIFLRAAELLSGPYRAKINAATMLGQSKTPIQAEIDSACELADFFRFNVYNTMQIYSEQPASSKGLWNRNEYRPLEGFVMAISPFNFTSIGGNLPAAPATAGNVCLWKPSSTAVLSNYYVMQILMEAGLPAGVINFVPCKGSDVSKYVLTDPNMAGFHFTGSTAVFQGVWKLVGENIANYKTYPRLVGETGGKDFIFAHPTANVNKVVTAICKGAFEYQGQKCSAASRAYIPSNIYEDVKAGVLEEIKKIKVGDVADFTNFMGAVIDKASFDKLSAVIDQANSDEDAEVLTGSYDGSKGYFIYPTVIEAKKPDYVTMRDELFGPIITIYKYDENDVDGALDLCDNGSMYGLTGAIFAEDRNAVAHMEKALTNAAGNFYINDRPTGAVVGQQPFGGSRASGTNDKAGATTNMQRWITIRTIKENFLSERVVDYPYMSEE